MNYFNTICLGLALLLPCGAVLGQVPQTGVRPAAVAGAPRVKVWRAAGDKAVTGLAVAPTRVLVTTGEADLELFAPDGAPQKSFELRDSDGFRWPAYAAAIAPDGAQALVANIDLNARLVNLDTEKIASAFNGGDVVRVTAIALGANQIAVGTAYSLSAFEIEPRRRIPGLVVPKNGVGSLAFSPDGALLATGLEDHSVRLFDAKSGAEIARLGAHEAAVRALAWTADGQKLASGARDGTIKVWDVAAKSELKSFSGGGGAIESLAFYRQPNLLAVGLSPLGAEAPNKASEPQLQPMAPVAKAQLVAELWDVSGESARLKREVSGVFGARQVAFTPDGRALLVGYADGSVRAHDLGTMTPATANPVAVATGAAVAFDARGLRQLSGIAGGTQCVAYSANQLAGGGKDGAIGVWDARSGALVGHRGQHTNAINSLAWSPDGALLASGGEDDLEVSAATKTLWKAPGRALVAGWSGDGKTLYALSENNGQPNLYAFDAQTGAHGESLGKMPHPFCAGLSFDKKTVIAGAYAASNPKNSRSAFSALYYFGVNAPQTATQSGQVKGYVRALALEPLPDGDTRAYTDDGDGTDHFDDFSKPIAGTLGWHSFAVKGKTERSDLSFDRPIVTLAVASDGRLAVGMARLGRLPAMVSLYNAQGQLQASWSSEALESELESVAFAGDGKTLAIGLGNRAPFEWNGKNNIGPAPQNDEELQGGGA